MQFLNGISLCYNISAPISKDFPLKEPEQACSLGPGMRNCSGSFVEIWCQPHSDLWLWWGRFLCSFLAEDIPQEGRKWAVSLEPHFRSATTISICAAQRTMDELSHWPDKPLPDCSLGAQPSPVPGTCMGQKCSVTGSTHCELEIKARLASLIAA